MTLIIMNTIVILEGVKMFMMITTNFVERLHEEAIEQRLHQAKGLMQQKIIGATDTTQTRGKFVVEVKRYDEENRRKLSSSSKVVLSE